jgi:hypothetical protein
MSTIIQGPKVSHARILAAVPTGALITATAEISRIVATVTDAVCCQRAEVDVKNVARIALPRQE